MPKYCYRFGKLIEGNGNQTDLLGGKGNSLQRLSKLYPDRVPAGFTIAMNRPPNFKKLKTFQKEYRDCIQYLRSCSSTDEPLVSVRSGSSVSMPGMMDTVLGAKIDDVPKYVDQIIASWNSEPAVAYRKEHGIPDHIGTAVTVQLMVFGDSDSTDSLSGTGVMFSRNPNTGDNELFGEWLPNAKGSSLVDGTSTPETLSSMLYANGAAYVDLFRDIAHTLEHDYKYPVDIEFTIEEGHVYLLQCRKAFMTTPAKLKSLYEMAAALDITMDEACSHVSTYDYNSCRSVTIDPAYAGTHDAEGIPASGGIVSGVVVTEARESYDDIGGNAILVRPETSTDDIKGMIAAEGILTVLGGSTSHAAVVARSMNKVCVVGCAGADKLVAGTPITIDGNTGRVYFKEVPTVVNGSEYIDKFVSYMFSTCGAYEYMSALEFSQLIACNAGVPYTMPERVCVDLWDIDDASEFTLFAKMLTASVKTELYKGKMVIVLTTSECYLTPSEMDLRRLFSEIYTNDLLFLKLKALLTHIPKGSDISFIIPAHRDDLKARVLKHGLSLIETVSTVEQLLGSSGAVVIGDDLREVCGGDGPAIQLVDALSHSSKSCISLVDICKRSNIFTRGGNNA